MPSPNLRIEDFAFTTACPEIEDVWAWSEAVARAVVAAAGASAERASLSGGLAGRPMPVGGRVALNILGVKKKGNTHEFSVAQALFDAEGTPIRWTFALDPDGDPKKFDVLRVFGLTEADVGKLKALSIKTPRKAMKPPLGPFAIERPADQLVSSGPTVAVRTEGDVRFFSHAGAPLGEAKIPGRPQTMALSPDGTELVGGLKKLTIVGLDGATRMVLDGHPRGEVAGLAFSRSGELLVSASGLTDQGGERSVAVWERATGTRRARRELSDVPRRVAFDHDGEFVGVATWRSDAVLRFTSDLLPAGEIRFGSETGLDGVCAAGNRMVVAVGTQLFSVDLKTMTKKVLDVPTTSHGFVLYALTPRGDRAVVVTAQGGERMSHHFVVLSVEHGDVIESRACEEDAVPQVAATLSEDRLLLGRGRSLWVTTLAGEPT